MWWDMQLLGCPRTAGHGMCPCTQNRNPQMHWLAAERSVSQVRALAWKDRKISQCFRLLLLLP